MREPAADADAWVSVHTFYHGDLDRLLVDAVAPLLDELAEDGLAEDGFFVRYWDGGPHLRLRVLPAPGVPRASVAEFVRARLVEHVTCHPGAAGMTQEQYARLAPFLARGERTDGYEPRLYPNNTVIALPYRREHDRYGHGAAIEAVERHFVESSRIALRVVHLGATRQQRAVLACAAILLAAHLGGTPPRGRVTGDVDPRALADATRLAEWARAVAADAAAATTTGTLTAWARALIRLRDALNAAGDPAPSPIGDVLDLCAHLVCNRLGVGLDVETRIRSLALRVSMEER
jgi:hypothetical protein